MRYVELPLALCRKFGKTTQPTETSRYAAFMISVPNVCGDESNMIFVHSARLTSIEEISAGTIGLAIENHYAFGSRWPS